MNRIAGLFRKELRFYLNSPVLWVIAVVFLVLSAVLFDFPGFVARDQASLRPWFGLFPLLFTLFIPALTMRSWSEETRQGTREVLLTLPVTEAQLVLGKFLASLAVLAGLMVLTLPVPWAISLLGDVDLGILASEYLGMVLLGAVGVALGLFVSSLTRNQVAAFLVTAGILLAFTLMDNLPRTWNLPDPVADAMRFLSLGARSQSFMKGLLDTRDMVYLTGCTGFFLFLNERSLVLGKWS